MKKYITAYISFFDFEMKMNFVFADNEKEALIKMLVQEFNFSEKEEEIEYIRFLNSLSEEEIKQEAFNSDSMIGVYCIS